MQNFNLNDAVSLVNTTKEKALTLNQSGNSLRTRISPKLLNDIGSPDKVEVLSIENCVLILAAREGKKYLEIGKGRYLYDSNLAKSIADLAGIDFSEREANGEAKSVQVGTYEIQEMNGIDVAVISFDESK